MQTDAALEGGEKRGTGPDELRGYGKSRAEAKWTDRANGAVDAYETNQKKSSRF